jgi:hypothetical protein
LARGGGILILPRGRLIPAGVAALAIGFAFGMHGTPPRVSASETILPKNLSKNFTPDFDAYFRPAADLGTPARAQVSDRGRWRLASLESEPVLLPASEDREPGITASPRSRGSSAATDLRAASFEERFFGAVDWPGSRPAGEAQEPAGNLLVPPLSEPARRTVGPSARGGVPLPVSSPVSAGKKQIRVAEAVDDSSPSAAPAPPADADDHTAIYDIAAHKVYLPNGRKLEAHSGLGSHMDDPRYVSERDRGPTPPNVYDLSLREESFHGVRALRLTPVGSGNMFGRDGMLAHSYMLGPNGQSNGCVSFNDYQAFLSAYLSGEVTRLVVVDHLATPPNPVTALGWIPEKIKALFGRS